MTADSQKLLDDLDEGDDIEITVGNEAKRTMFYEVRGKFRSLRNVRGIACIELDEAEHVGPAIFRFKPEVISVLRLDNVHSIKRLSCPA